MVGEDVPATEREGELAAVRMRLAKALLGSTTRTWGDCLNAADRLIESMTSPSRCTCCGKDPAEGFATMGDERYCHEWPDPTCYQQASTQPSMSTTDLLASLRADRSTGEATDG